MFMKFRLFLTAIQNTLLGGVNMVDVSPFGGNYSGVVVTNNSIAGGFASQPASGSATKGTNNEDVVIKYVEQHLICS